MAISLEICFEKKTKFPWIVEKVGNKRELGRKTKENYIITPLCRIYLFQDLFFSELYLVTVQFQDSSFSGFIVFATPDFRMLGLDCKTYLYTNPHLNYTHGIKTFQKFG